MADRLILLQFVFIILHKFYESTLYMPISEIYDNGEICIE